jgi:hypothetical protein
MDRNEMIHFLCESDFRYIMECANGPELLDSYIQWGFKGYENYTDEELRVEYAQRKEIENA